MFLFMAEGSNGADVVGQDSDMLKLTYEKKSWYKYARTYVKYKNIGCVVEHVILHYCTIIFALGVHSLHK